MIREDRSNATDLELVFPDGTIASTYLAILGVPPPDPGAQVVLDAIRDFIYTQLDSRQKKNSLPLDDPARSTDPATEGYFWDGGGGNPDIVTRPYIIVVSWDGERYQYMIRISR